MVTKMDRIKVSAVLITYNQAQFVSNAIESILMQETNFEFELIIGDDASKDGTVEILKKFKQKYPSKIKLILNKKNEGASANFFSVLQNCKGEYLAPLEGDDFWLDKKRLQTLVDFLDNNPSYMCVSHRRERRDMNGNILGFDPVDELLNKPFTIKDFIKGKRFSVMGSVFRNFLSSDAEKYANYMKCTRNVADYQTAISILDLGPVYILPNIFGVYRVQINIKGASNYNSITSSIKQYQDHINILLNTQLFFENKYDVGEEINTRTALILLYCIKRFKYRDMINIFKLAPNKITVLKITGSLLLNRLKGS